MKYKLFGTQTGLPASELILGAANFGARRGYGADADEIPKILGSFTDAGGNFIDVADQYQLGEAEESVGKFVKPNRHNYILCTKYSRSSEHAPSPVIFGNHRKAMREAVEGSLKRLQTDYIDLYMPHFDDGLTPIDEIARGLEDLVRDGKVLYTGLANFPAWKVAGIASQIKLDAIQIEYNMVQRTAERELLPMAAYYGLGAMFYSPLAGGLLTGKYRNGSSGRLTQNAVEDYQEDAHTTGILNELEVIATELNTNPGQIALAWVLTKNAFTITGARTAKQLEDSIAALSVHLGRDHMARLETVSAISLGYPHELLKTVQRSY
jgi:aryl-alcohol dehydrogenase-like predicted oxidoreductase